MEAFTYWNPVQVFFGEGTLGQVGEIVRKYGKTALLVSYREHDFFRSAIEEIHRSLERAGVACTDFFGVTANPTLSQARAGVALCRAENIGTVIALGGGSVMDCVKIIASGVPYPTDIRDMVMFSHSDVRAIAPKASLPTVMIPTLPATGSEMNPTAVITDEEAHRKSYVWHPTLYPKAAVMDPALTRSLPPYQTACGAFDIVAHVMEAYVNGAPGMNLSVQEGMQEGVIRAVLEALPAVRQNPDDLQARGALMWAASIALNGWLTSGTFGFTPMHQMGHVLSARYGATHGATLACLMPAWMRYFEKRADNEKYAQFARRVFALPLGEAADAFERLMRSYGVQTRTRELGVGEEDAEMLADEVVAVSFGPDGLLNGRPKMSARDIVNLYRLSW